MKSLIATILILLAIANCQIYLTEGKEEEKNQGEVTCKERTGADGGAILCWPKQLSNDRKHGVVVWGPGGGTEPGAYKGMIDRLASHGFVVIALSSSPGDASKAGAAINWLKGLNDSGNPVAELKGKIDTNTIGCSGHSMGGLESEQAVIKFNEVKTAFLDNSGDLGHTAMSNCPPTKTIGVCYGNEGMERGNAEADYGNPGVKAPACSLMMDGSNHGHGSCPWDGMAATVAWMRWHLGGEDFRKNDFVSAGGKYQSGPIIGAKGNWKGQCKNF